MGNMDRRRFLKTGIVAGAYPDRFVKDAFNGDRLASKRARFTAANGVPPAVRQLVLLHRLRLSCLCR